MGCPDIYYKRALQCFAYTLVSLEDKNLANELLEEKSEEKLESFISHKRNFIMKNNFILMPEG